MGLVLSPEIGVILGHRYYSTSFPTPDISTENLPSLTTEQALADQEHSLSGQRVPEAFLSLCRKDDIHVRWE